MEQQMGVAIVGLATYRNEKGKLCTFEYVTPPLIVYLFNEDSA